MTEAANGLDPTNGHWWLGALVMVLVAPLIEEFVLRGGIHQVLIRIATQARLTASPGKNAEGRHFDRGLAWMQALLARPLTRLCLVAGLFGVMHLPRGLMLAFAVIPAGLLIGWVFERFRSWRRCAVVHALLNAAWIGLALIALPAHADALRGKTLYASTPPTGGVACATAGCHNADPTSNVNKILRGANNASLITSAINGNTGGMGLLKNKWSATDITDIALYLGNPGVTGAAAASLSPSSLAWPSTVTGSAASAQTVTLSNTGNAALSITGMALGGTHSGDFSAAGSGSCGAGGSLAAGGTCTVSVGFTPQASGARSGILTVSHSVGQSTVTLSGSGAAAPQATISLNQNLLNLGPVTQGTSSATQTIVVSNTGTAALVLSGLSFNGVPAGVYSNTGSCAVGAPVAPASSCTIDVRFSPAAIAAYNGSLQLTSNASNGAVSVTLQGTGTAVPAPLLSISPGSLGFGNQTVGSTSGSQLITVQNTGTAAASLSLPTLAGSAMFAMVNANACGTSLAAGSSCSLQVLFRPSTATAQTGTLSIANNAGAALQVSLSGTGVTQPTPSPTLAQSAPMAFPDTTVGQQSGNVSTTAGNSGSASYTITQVSLGGAQISDFLLTGDCTAGKVIASGATCTLTVRFAPSAVGLRQARVNLVTDGGTTLGFDVQGNGKAVATVSGQLSGNTMSFASLVTGNTSSAQRSTLVNTGNQTLSIASVSITAPFNLLTDSTTCPAAPFTLSPGLQCDFAVRFAPTVSGSATGSLNIATLAPGPALTVSLSGSSTDPGSAPFSNGTDTSTSTTTTSTAAGADATNTATADAGAAGSAAKDNTAAPMNIGAGGCTMSPTGNDASMVILLLAALITGLWRRSFTRSQSKESA